MQAAGRLQEKNWDTLDGLDALNILDGFGCFGALFARFGHSGTFFDVALPYSTKKLPGQKLLRKITKHRPKI